MSRHPGGAGGRTRIRRLFEAMAADPALKILCRDRPRQVGFFIQEPALGWGIEFADGGPVYLDRFPYGTADRLFFHRGEDFHRFASGTPWIWLALRGRVHRWGSAEALRLLRRTLVRLYNQ